MSGPDPRVELIRVARRMVAEGLVRGTSGNVSMREVRAGRNGLLITPTGVPYDQLEPDDVPFMSLERGSEGPGAQDGQYEGRRAPSSEWRIHRDLYLARPEVGAVLHAHPPFAVALACLRRGLPAFHYLVARFGGADVRCATYAGYGTQELSDAALSALRGRAGCLLANHGSVVCGRDLGQALALGIELEQLCEQYWRACQLGEPVLLPAEEMARVLVRLAGYGQRVQ